MDTQYLKAIWDKACEKHSKVILDNIREHDFDQMSSNAVYHIIKSPAPDFELPFFDQAQQLVEFIKNHDLKALQRMKQPLTQEDASWLLSRYSIEDIEEVLLDMNNYPQLNRKYKSCKLTANNWLRKRTKDKQEPDQPTHRIRVT